MKKGQEINQKVLPVKNSENIFREAGDRYNILLKAHQRIRHIQRNIQVKAFGSMNRLKDFW